MSDLYTQNQKLREDYTQSIINSNEAIAELQAKVEAAEKLSTEVSNLLGAGFGLNDYWRDRMKKAIAAFEEKPDE